MYLIVIGTLLLKLSANLVSSECDDCKVKCLGMKDVDFGKTKCKFNEPNEVRKVHYRDDYEYMCSFKCEVKIKDKNWKKACCEVGPLEENGMACKFHYNAEVVDGDGIEGDGGRKAVQCKDPTLTTTTQSTSITVFDITTEAEGGKNTTFEEMGTTRSGRLTTNSNEAVSSTSGKNITTNLVDRKKTSKKGNKPVAPDDGETPGFAVKNQVEGCTMLLALASLFFQI